MYQYVFILMSVLVSVISICAYIHTKPMSIFLCACVCTHVCLCLNVRVVCVHVEHIILSKYKYVVNTFE